MMNNEQENWLTIIPATPASEFDAILQRWREENRAALQRIEADRFVIDVIRGTDGQTLRRLRMAI
jgi:hypothetical protein